MCFSEEELMDHLFMHCWFMHQLWGSFLVQMGAVWIFPHDFRSLLYGWFLAGLKERPKCFGIISWSHLFKCLKGEKREIFRTKLVALRILQLRRITPYMIGAWLEKISIQTSLVLNVVQGDPYSYELVYRAGFRFVFLFLSLVVSVQLTFLVNSVFFLSPLNGILLSSSSFFQ